MCTKTSVDSNLNKKRRKISEYSHNQSKTHHCQTFVRCLDHNQEPFAFLLSNGPCPIQNSFLASAHVTKDSSIVLASFPAKSIYIFVYKDSVAQWFSRVMKTTKTFKKL